LKLGEWEVEGENSLGLWVWSKPVNKLEAHKMSIFVAMIKDSNDDFWDENVSNLASLGERKPLQLQLPVYPIWRSNFT